MRTASYSRSSSNTLLICFNLRCTGTEGRLRREHAGWRGLADIEWLDVEHAVFVIRPGGALRLTR